MKERRPFLFFLCAQLSIGLFHYREAYLDEPAKLAALVSGSCIIFLCIKRRKKFSFISASLLYYISCVGIGIASAPSGDNNHCPFPFLFSLFHLLVFAGVFIFQKSIPDERQPLIPFFFSALVYFLPYLPNVRVARKVDRRTRSPSFSFRDSNFYL